MDWFRFGVSGSTPFGIFDNDGEFQTESSTILAKWCAKRLGYPIMALNYKTLNFTAVLKKVLVSIQQNKSI